MGGRGTDGGKKTKNSFSKPFLFSSFEIPWACKTQGQNGTKKKAFLYIYIAFLVPFIIYYILYIKSCLYIGFN